MEISDSIAACVNTESMYLKIISLFFKCSLLAAI